MGMEPEDWPYKAAHIATGNRFGKSVMFAVVMLWFGFYKHRCPAEYGTPEWYDFPYAAVNVGPLNENAFVVREKVGLILQDKAKEQLMRKGGRGHIHPAVVMAFRQAKDRREMDRSGNPFLLTIPDTEYKGYLTEHNVYLEFRTTDDDARALQGRVKYLVCFDEAGRYKDCVTLIASDVVPRTIDSRGVVMTATTPHLETDSDYEEVWKMGDPSNPDRAKYQISFTGSMKDNPHVTAQMIEESLDGQPDYLYDQIVDGKFVQSEEAFYNAVSIERAGLAIPNERRRTRGHVYVISFDLAVAKAGDRSISVVWDVTKDPCEVVEFTEFPKGTKQPALVQSMRETLEWYTNERMECSALLVFDETGMGGLLFRDDLALLRPKPRGFQFAGGKHKKLSILTTLKLFLDKGWVVYPKECTRIKYELKRYKRSDEKLETDAVMAMAMAAHYAERLRKVGKDRRLITDSLTTWS